MTRGYTEYNETIKLRQRDMADIVSKVKQSGCRYYMQLNLQGRSVWVAFNEPFESGIDRLYALYYKIPAEDEVVRICIGLWRSVPSRDTVYLQMMGVGNTPDPMITHDLVHNFLNIKLTDYIELRRPTYKSKNRLINNAFDSEADL